MDRPRRRNARRAGRPRGGRALAGLALLAMVLLATPAAGHPESAASSLRTDVVAAWHEPERVEPGTQWQGFLQLKPGSNVTAASYQVCRVGLACFAPPTAAHAIGNGTWRFDTADYLANGRPVDYEAGWRLGVKWWLTESRGNGTALVEFPQGPDVTSPQCRDAALSCAEAHYLAFDMPPPPNRAPLPSAAVWAVVLLALALAGRR